jgi:hypothetical protein
MPPGHYYRKNKRATADDPGVEFVRSIAAALEPL